MGVINGNGGIVDGDIGVVDGYGAFVDKNGEAIYGMMEMLGVGVGGCSSAGRAHDLWSGGRGIDSRSGRPFRIGLFVVSTMCPA